MGKPLILSEMTYLTALRTACVSALAAKYMAKKNTSVVGIIGLGAQSEYQILALTRVFNIKQVFCYDIDSAAMDKFITNMSYLDINFVVVGSASSVVKNAKDILVTCTSKAGFNKVVCVDDINSGVHINAVGGDGPKKTELDPLLLKKAKIVIEFLPQTTIEGEIQQLSKPGPVTELWECVKGVKVRDSDDTVTIFDSVGFSVEDFTVLSLVLSIVENDSSFVKQTFFLIWIFLSFYLAACFYNIFFFFIFIYKTRVFFFPFKSFC